MTIYTHFMITPEQRDIANAQAISDELQARLQTLADAIDEAGARIILHYQDRGPCTLVVNGPDGLKEEIRNLVGPAETWS